MSVKERLKKASASGYRLLFARPLFGPFNRHLVYLGMTGLGFFNYEDEWSMGEAAFLRRFARECSAPTVIDVGANVGRYTELVLRVAPKAHVLAFEPHVKSFQLLRGKSDHLRFEAFNVAVGSIDGTTELFDYADRDGSSHASVYEGVLKRIHRSQDVVSHSVPMVTLDSVVASHGIDKIDLLKIDTEGNELDVLRGAERTIADGKIDLIQLEFNEMNIESRVFFRDIMDALPQYSFFRMLPTALLPIEHYSPAGCEVFAFHNIVAKRRV